MNSKPESIRVLHVDDEPEFGELVSTFLEREEPRFSVECVVSAEAGLTRLGKEQFDCIVSDYQMPGTNGIEFLNQVRERYSDLPFVLFTGKGSEEIASEAITAGVTDYLQKATGPDQYSILANRIINAVTGYRARKRASRMAEQLDAIRENVTEVIWISSPEKDEIRFVSDAYRDVWGRPPESLIEDPTSFVAAVHPDDADRVRSALGRQGSQPEAYDETYRVVQPDGSVRWVHDRASGIYEDGTLTGIVGIATDITALKESEQALQEEQTFIESALKIAVDFYWGIDLEGYVTRWSDTDGTVTGYPTEEAIGLHTSTFHPEDHFPRIEEAIEEMKQTGSVRVEADLLTKEGRRIPFEFIGSVVTDEDGVVQSLCGIGRAMSDQTEQQ